jgi:hypothetical protein
MSLKVAHRDATDDGPVRRNWVNSGRAVIASNRSILTLTGPRQAKACQEGAWQLRQQDREHHTRAIAPGFPVARLCRGRLILSREGQQ